MNTTHSAGQQTLAGTVEPHELQNQATMTTTQGLNRFLAAAKPSATYEVMDRVAARRAEGARIISLSAGEPDFDTPQHVRDAGIEAIRKGHTRYTQVAGLRALREAVAAKFERENSLQVDWRHTLVTSGGKQVIFNALAATLNEGDELADPQLAVQPYGRGVRP